MHCIIGQLSQGKSKDKDGGNSSPQNSKYNMRSSKINSIISIAEQAEEEEQKFFEGNVWNCKRPWKFPMDNTYVVERTPTPFVKNTNITEFGSGNSYNYALGITTSTTVLQQKFLPNNFFSSVDGRSFQNPTLETNRINSLYEDLEFLKLDIQELLQSKIMTSKSYENTRFALPASEIYIMATSSPLKKSGTVSNRSDFASVLKKWSAPIPPVLSRKLGRVPDSPLGKVKVMLRICDYSEDASGILRIEPRRRQVTLVDPSGNTNSGPTPEERRVGVSAPKMFAFDGIFGDEDDQAEVCAASAAELVASVVGGEDGCFVSLGSSSTGKKQTMFGKPSNQKMGIIPTTISWLFKSIQEQKQKKGSRFSIRISAFTVSGGSGHEVINDLLVQFDNDGEKSPGSYLMDNNLGDHKPGNKFSSASQPILNGISEIRASDPETAGLFLDAALESFSNDDHAFHFVYTIHVYQYTIDKNGKGVIGGRSRLHLVTIGNGSPSISVLGGLLLSVLNGQRHLPSRDSKLGAILRECLGSLTCRAVVMIHVSNVHSRYAETLAALQLGSRVHRLRRSRRLKMGSVGSGNGSGGSSGGSGEEMRNGSVLNSIIHASSGINGTICEVETGSSDIDPSSSEQSCDTVIYLGPALDDATDGEHPPVYLPSLDGENLGETKILGTKSHVNGTGNIPPKTKSPKPKTTHSHHGNYNTVKTEEQWVDGPKLSKGLPQKSNVVHKSGLTNTESPRKGETWIDGPAATRGVANQGNNFPSPKKTPNKRGSYMPMPQLACPSISSTKAQMIHEWIASQPDSNMIFDELTVTNSLLANHSNKRTYNDPHLFIEESQTSFLQSLYGSSSYTRQNNEKLFANEPEYKALTVFKTCDDYDEDNTNEYEFEFIEVVEPEVPVPTRDASFQVTEEDIALSFLEENPLPESDQNYIVGKASYYFNCTQSPQLSPTPKLSSFKSYSPHEIGKQNGNCCGARGTPSQSPSTNSCFSPTHSLSNFNDDHPLRVLSQECLTVVSTFADSISINEGDMERYWPMKDSNILFHNSGSEFHKTISSMPPSSLQDIREICPTFTQDSGEKPNRNLEEKIPVLSVPDPPVLSDESIYRLPSEKHMKTSNAVEKVKKKTNTASDAEQESLTIPPMKLLDLTPIKSNVSKEAKRTEIPVRMPKSRGCDHNHDGGGRTVTEPPVSSPSEIILPLLEDDSNDQTFPSSPSVLTSSPDIISAVNTKSPSKSKSRKLAKFFRGRSKSPKVSGPSSESGKSSGSSSTEIKSSSSSAGSSCSGISPIPSIVVKPNSLNNSNYNHTVSQQLKNHSSPSKRSTSKTHQIPPNSTIDYHFDCDSVLPMFLPSPVNQAAMLAEIENGANNPIVN